MTETIAPRQILVLENDAHVLRECVSYLGKRGFETITCSDPETALQNIALCVPDALLLDASSGQEECLQLLNHLRDDVRTKNLPILVMASNEKVDEVRALTHGASDYVTRPLDFELLLARLQAQLDACDRARRLELRVELLLKRGSCDEVTGTPDRMLAMSALEAEVRRAARYRRPLSVLMMEIDHYHQTYLEHGDNAFNGLLRHVASVMSFTMRTSDVLARFEKGCFCAILPETDSSQAVRTGERLRQAVVCSPYRFDGCVIRAMLCIGSANYLGSGIATAPQELIATAENSLAQARKLSANQIQPLDAGRTTVDTRIETLNQEVE